MTSILSISATRSLPLPVLTSWHRWVSRLIEKLANQTLLFFILEAREKFGSKSGNCLGLVEGQLVIDFSALEVTRLATSLEDWLDLGGEIGLPAGRRWINSGRAGNVHF